MGDGTQENPFTREDVLKLIKEHGGSEGLDLSGKVFEDKIDLSGLNSEDLNLRGIKLIGAQLYRANFADTDLTDADFRQADLRAACFWKATGHGMITWGPTIVLSPAYLQGTDFRGAILLHANFKGCYFYGTKLEGAHIHGTDIYDAHLEEADWGNYKVGEEIEGEEGKKEEFYFAADVYRRLKMWYTEHGIYDTAGEFFFREMTAQRKRINWWLHPRHRAWSKFVSILSGYGERPFRVVASGAVVVFGLAAAYYLFGGLTVPYSLYYSAVSFTALGYGSWAFRPPEDWVQAVGAAESFIGVFMIALFLITFTRKMRR